MFLRSRRGWLLGTALLVAGCLSPTLPLPPPDAPTMASTDTAGLVRLTGSVEPGSEVFALNRSTNLIAGQYTESGAYDFTIQAQERDPITFWYVRGNVESPPVDFLVKLELTQP
ncbi:MAG TPA: hypothetical protein VFK05_34545 [Polyangiaceae bacterium]|nr:hypothetical protein [Polyangiaceae bacterium]